MKTFVPGCECPSEEQHTEVHYFANCPAPSRGCSSPSETAPQHFNLRAKCLGKIHLQFLSWHKGTLHRCWKRPGLTVRFIAVVIKRKICAQSPAANTCWQHKLTHESKRYNLKCRAALDKKKS